jgi:hypothetical protein
VRAGESVEVSGLAAGARVAVAPVLGIADGDKLEVASGDAGTAGAP